MRARGPHRTETFTSSKLLKSATATANEFFYRRIHKQATKLAYGFWCRFCRTDPLNVSVGSGSLPPPESLPMISQSVIIGGGERDRTDDLLLAKQALSQLSYTPDKTWWVWLDLNQRPHAYQACALTS
jgi:hypothetical protein